MFIKRTFLLQSLRGTLLFAPLTSSGVQQPVQAAAAAAISSPSGTFTFGQIQGAAAPIAQQPLVQQPLFTQPAAPASQFPIQALPAPVTSNFNNNNLNSGGGGSLSSLAL
jgi:hypothetical protein